MQGDSVEGQRCAIVTPTPPGRRPQWGRVTVAEAFSKAWVAEHHSGSLAQECRQHMAVRANRACTQGRQRLRERIHSHRDHTKPHTFRSQHRGTCSKAVLKYTLAHPGEPPREAGSIWDSPGGSHCEELILPWPQWGLQAPLWRLPSAH